MANQYLFEIHRYISETLAQIKLQQAEMQHQGNALEAAFWAGQLQELTDLKCYLTGQYNLATQSYP
ncbi:MAG: hypothetical protein C0403_02980 [Desulfobacterium sp.]|nr:hypothetical protein [Desulfobacterium sp.]